jgi:hypothetical protein
MDTRNESGHDALSVWEYVEKPAKNETPVETGVHSSAVWTPGQARGFGCKMRMQIIEREPNLLPNCRYSITLCRSGLESRLPAYPSIGYPPVRWATKCSAYCGLTRRDLVCPPWVIKFALALVTHMIQVSTSLHVEQVRGIQKVGHRHLLSESFGPRTQSEHEYLIRTSLKTTLKFFSSLPGLTR